MARQSSPTSDKLIVPQILNSSKPFKHFDKSKIKERIGVGAEGEVWKYDKNKILKVIWPYGMRSSAQFNKLMSRLARRSRLYTRVYDYGEFVFKRQSYQFYIAERIDVQNQKYISINEQDYLHNKLIKIGLRCWDLHDGNILFDKKKNMKIVDLTALEII